MLQVPRCRTGSGPGWWLRVDRMDSLRLRVTTGAGQPGREREATAVDGTA